MKSLSHLYLSVYTNQFDPEIVNDYLKFEDSLVCKIGDTSIDGIIIKRNLWEKSLYIFKSYLLSNIKDNTFKLFESKANEFLILKQFPFEVSLNLVTYKNKNDVIGIDFTLSDFELLLNFGIEFTYNVYDYVSIPKDIKLQSKKK